MMRKTRPAERSRRAAVQPPAAVLLVDIGNTRIKWSVWRDGRLGRMHAEEHAGWSSADYARRIFRGAASRVTRILVSSVASDGVVRRLAAAAEREAGVPPELIATSRRAAGVETRYTEPWRLGVDRFMGVIAARRLAQSRAACVVNVGTAVTVDFVDPCGVHHGGAILPGPQLMIDALLRRTAGIARRARGKRQAPARRPGPAVSLFAHDTATAIERGAWHAVAAIVEHAFGECFGRFGGEPLVILTGGGATQVRPLISVPHVEIADLVLAGIALHAGLELK